MGKRAKSDDWEPSLGNDSGEDVAVVMYEDADGGRHAVAVPRSVKALKGEAAEIVHEIQVQTRLAMKARSRLDELVPEARSYGVSWNVIGWSTGMAAQSAQGRWRNDG
jgi:hypothetical protein